MDDNKEILKLSNIYKSYKSKNETIDILSKCSISFESGKFYAIMGHSGSGKSTLINILGLIDNDYSGEYEFFGKKISDCNENTISCFRFEKIGFVFQNFLLNDNLKAYENIMIPMLINKSILPKDRKEKALELLERVGMKNRYNHYPKELSGGEKQRVAVARAIANNPDIILADEPTGNLDEHNEQEIFELLKNISNSGKCVIVVSHSNEVKKYADRVLKINEGRVEDIK